ncbi:hypothetical protein TGAM01_v210295 [Trichoderma gamsii]|uniref:Uncharacterized protein n=1 Tax=Trichoderma gamsii TaxID=398673 RepID=A0A0W7W3P0_9HYPO|nr:hypothetical protein TGAM01_v210295 [Trichoderma gamsii]PNP40034.1 hypothetical protein TGAMA5MH_07956 [Trichoderma gamsii]PON20896.1 hypothetical protein TGAM01_v210295 [Trichoderma gamsii]
MKFSTILAVLPVAFAASGTLKAKLAAREDGCVKYNACIANGEGRCNPCDCHPDYDLCRFGGIAPYGW